MKKGLKVALIVASTFVAVVGVCTLVCSYIMKNWLKDFKLDDEIFFDEETNVCPENEVV